MMKKRQSLLLLGAAIAALVAMPVRAEILDSWDDLDLSGNIVKAISFTSAADAATNRLVNGVTFKSLGPASTVDPDVINNATLGIAIGGSGGYYPGTTSLQRGVIYTTAAVGTTIGVTVPALADGRYKVQILCYDAWAGPGVRTADIAVEGTTIYSGYDYYVEQGSTVAGTGGSMITCVVDVTGGLDIGLKKIMTNSPHLNALIVSTATGEPLSCSKKRLYDASDLGLDPTKVVKAIDFGSGTPGVPRKINGVTFLRAANNTTVDGVTNNANASVYSGTAATFDLDRVASSLISGFVSPGGTATVGGADLNVDVSNLDPAYYYQVQLILTEMWGAGSPVNPAALGRKVDIYMEGTKVADDYSYGIEQGSTFASSVFKRTNVTVSGDGTLNLVLDPENYDALLSGLVITKGGLVPEPSTMMLIVCGFLSLIACRRP